MRNSNVNICKYTVDIFLGGSCKTSWRENAAIPLLKKHGLTYYNPAIRETNDAYNESNFTNGNNVIVHWKNKMDNSRVLLFVITNDTRSLTSMIIAAHYIGLDKNIVLCIQHLPLDESVVENEKVCLVHCIFFEVPVIIISFFPAIKTSYKRL